MAQFTATGEMDFAAGRIRWAVAVTDPPPDKCVADVTAAHLHRLDTATLITDLNRLGEGEGASDTKGA
jgi:hypothetical protein